MWLSSRLRPAVPTADADLGTTTIAGGSAGVLTRGEVRDLPVYGPGGYIWQPAGGDAVLVIKGGPGGEEQCVAGARQKKPPMALRPGEVCLYAPGGASIRLRNDGALELRGAVRIQGELIVNGEPYMPCICGKEES